MTRFVRFAAAALALVVGFIAHAGDTSVVGAARPCIFCEIAAGRLESELVVYRDELVVAWRRGDGTDGTVQRTPEDGPAPGH